MNPRLLLFGLLLTSLVGVVAAAQESVGMQAISITTDPAPLEAGDDADLDFKIRNAGTGGAEDITVRINDTYPFSTKEDRKRVFELGDVQSLTEYFISTEIVVDENAPDGVNTLPVIIENDRFTVTKELRLDVEQDTADLQLANLQTDPTTLTADTDDVTLTVDLVNNGETEAENVVTTLELPTAFEPVSSFSSRSSLGNIAPGERKSASFTVDISEDAGKGEVSLPTTVSYGEDNSEYTVQDSIGVYLSGRPDLQLVNSTSEVRVGSDGTITLSVINAGSEESSATRVRAIQVSDIPIEYDSASKYIGTLEPGQSGTAVFDVTVETGAPAKDYLLDFELRGVDDESVSVNDVTTAIPAAPANQDNSGLPWVYIALTVAGVVILGLIVYRKL